MQFKTSSVRCSEAGFTLIEVVLALVVVSVGALVTFSTMTTTANVDEGLHERGIALRGILAAQERVLAWDYEGDIQQLVDHFSDPANATFEVEDLTPPEGGMLAPGFPVEGGLGTIAWDASDSDRLVLTVTVAWQSRKGPQSMSLPRIITEVSP